MVNLVLETITKYNLIESGDKIVLGVSGGPDSIAMLNILYNLKKENVFDIDLYVAHINHGIRENAKLDEKFVREYCEERNIPCYVLNVNVVTLAAEEKRGVEETGRKIRYEFFDEVAEKVNANKIAIAHNQNDRVETIIMNVLRGSGLAGLKGIEPKQQNYIRPLIECDRSIIEKYCEDENLNPRLDESNLENDYTRNKIRNIVIPYIKEEFNPNINNTILRLSDIVKEDLEYINSKIREEYLKIVEHEENLFKSNVYDSEKESTIILDLKKFLNLDIVIKKGIILYSVEKIFGNTKGIEKIHIEDIIKLCEKNIGNKFLTPNKKTKIVIKNKKIYIMSVK